MAVDSWRLVRRVSALLAGDQGQRAAQLHPQGPEREARVAEQIQGQARGGLLLPRRRDARMHQTGQLLLVQMPADTL